MDDDKYYRKLINIDTLKLAFTQLQTGQNIWYKNYYRELFISYSLNLEKNLKILHQRLKEHIYEPKDILRFYLPKKSGLHRPMTFLHFDDLIIFQAFTVVLKRDFSQKREKIENVNVFSNLINSNKNEQDFLFEKWQNGYNKFVKNVKKYYKNGNMWVAHFDLAAYYDTISHNRLLYEFKRKQNDTFSELFLKCLEMWSSHYGKKISHGIPQGPIASDFFAEIYLCSIDKKLNQKNVKYLRYVDDIKIFGKSREEILSGIIILEHECKEKGLIPQAKKYEIIKARNLDDAIGKNPSLSIDEKKIVFSEDSKKIFEIFKSAFKEDNFDIAKIKYILRVSGKNKEILNIVLKNIISHPELIDYFVDFLENYLNDFTVRDIIISFLRDENILYGYVEGKLWELLSFFDNSKIEKSFIYFTYCRLKEASCKFSLKYGIYHFLCSCEVLSLSKWLDIEPSGLIQMMIIPNLPKVIIENSNFQKAIFNRSDYEPGIVLYKQMLINNINTTNLPETPNDNTGILKNLVGTEIPSSITFILNKMFSLKNFNNWEIVFDTEYSHAKTILYFAFSCVNSNKSAWLNYFDTFNEILLRRLIEILNVKRENITWPKLNNNKGEMISYGVLLDNQNKFSSNYTQIADIFRKIHDRRCTLPLSHAYGKSTNEKTKILKKSERNQFIKGLKIAYNSLIVELERLL